MKDKLKMSEQISIYRNLEIIDMELLPVELTYVPPEVTFHCNFAFDVF